MADGDFRVRVVEVILMATIATNALHQKTLAIALLRSAKRTFQKSNPTRDELLHAGRAIARAVRSANDLGFRSDIQQALMEARLAAERAASAEEICAKH